MLHRLCRGVAPLAAAAAAAAAAAVNSQSECKLIKYHPHQHHPHPNNQQSLSQIICHHHLRPSLLHAARAAAASSSGSNSSTTSRHKLEQQLQPLLTKFSSSLQQGDAEAATAAHTAAFQLLIANGQQLPPGELHHARASLCSLVANEYLRVGRLVEAEHFFTASMQELVLANSGDYCSSEVVELSLKLANVFLATGRGDLAIEGLSFALQQVQTLLQRQVEQHGDSLSLAEVIVSDSVAFGPGGLSNAKELKELRQLRAEQLNLLALKALVLSNFAKSLRQLNQRRQEAEQMLEQALEIADQLFTAGGHANCASLLNDIAVLQSEAGQQELALESLHKSLQLLQKLRLSPRQQQEKQQLDELHCTAMHNLGLVLLQLGRLSEAGTACQRAKRLAERLQMREAAIAAEACLMRIESVGKGV